MKIRIPTPPFIFKSIGYWKHGLSYALIIICFGCQELEEQAPSSDIQAEIENDIHFISADQAEMIASTLQLPVVTSSKSQLTSSSRGGFELTELGTREIEDISSHLDDNGKALYHIINYKEDGFVIISADDRFAPVLAFSYFNSISATPKEETKEGLGDWYNYHKEVIEYVRENPESEVSQGEGSTTNNRENLWDPCAIQRQLTVENLSTDPCDPNGGGGCQDQFTQVGPLLSTQWDQDCGYNQLMPVLSCSPHCGRAYAGCVPVAMAQVMRFHEHPQGYNYSSMPNFSGNIHNAQLIVDIFNGFPSSQQSLFCWGTAIDPYVPQGYGQNFASLFTNSFGYSSATRAVYNGQSVRRNIDSGKPVILDGTGTFGHMWVADGYLRGVYCSGQTLLKLHMNWGWGGIGNGYFNYDNFTVTTPTGTRSFNQNKYMVFNITP